MEIAFWARVMDLVRKKLKEKLNNSLACFRDKFESKLKTVLLCEIVTIRLLILCLTSK